MWLGGQRHAPAALPRKKHPGPIVQKAEWVSGPIWTGARNLAATGNRSPARLAHSKVPVIGANNI
jgi:hypothetical protein